MTLLDIELDLEEALLNAEIAREIVRTVHASEFDCTAELAKLDEAIKAIKDIDATGKGRAHGSLPEGDKKTTVAPSTSLYTPPYVRTPLCKPAPAAETATIESQPEALPECSFTIGA